MRGILLAGAIVLVCAGGASACYSGGYAAENQTVDNPMEVKSGGNCAYTIRSAGPIESIVLAKKPSVGIVDIAGPRIRYRAKAGYAGADEYIVRINARSVVDKPFVWSSRVRVTISR